MYVIRTCLSTSLPGLRCIAAKRARMQFQICLTEDSSRVVTSQPIRRCSCTSPHFSPGLRLAPNPPKWLKFFLRNSNKHLRVLCALCGKYFFLVARNSSLVFTAKACTERSRRATPTFNNLCALSIKAGSSVSCFVLVLYRRSQVRAAFLH